MCACAGRTVTSWTPTATRLSTSAATPTPGVTCDSTRAPPSSTSSAPDDHAVSGAGPRRRGPAPPGAAGALGSWRPSRRLRRMSGTLLVREGHAHHAAGVALDLGVAARCARPRGGAGAGRRGVRRRARALGEPGEPALELGEEALRPGARAAAAALREGSGGRAIRFPGQEALVGRVRVGRRARTVGPRLAGRHRRHAD